MTREEEPRILLAHGGGGVMMQQLITDTVLSRLGNPILERLEDAAVLEPPNSRLAFTTDAFTVSPLFFRGGDVGRLAVCGTVNDLAAVGARPLALSLAVVVEEGLPLSTLERVLDSVAQAATEAEVQVVTGDTKVVEKGAADRLFLVTTGVGAVPEGIALSPKSIEPQDAVIVTGPLGDHGIAIISERKGLEFDTPVESDVAPLAGIAALGLECAGGGIHCMRDPTRGGAAAVLNEIASAAGVEIQIEEDQVPVRPEVAAACDMLGFDPLYVPCEGRLIIFCAQAAADSLVQRLKEHPLGTGTKRMGRVARRGDARVTMHTSIGGTRIVTMPYGEQLPRIC